MGRGRRALAIVAIIAVALGLFLGRSQLRPTAEEVVEAIGDWSTRLRDIAAVEHRTEVELRSREGESGSVFITLGSGPGDAAFALLATAPEAPSILVVLPQDLLVDTPGFGELRLVDALVFGGPDLAALAVINQFGIRLDAVAALPGGSIAAGLLGPVVVDLSVPFFVEGSDNSVTRILPGGRTEVMPDFVETLLVMAGVGDVFEWIQRQGSAWRAILNAVGEAPEVADRITALGGGDAAYGADLLVTAAAEPDAIMETVPLSRVATSVGLEAVAPLGDQTETFFRERMGHLLLRPGGRPRIEVLNGNGRVGTTGDISRILIRAGFRLVRTDNAENFDFEDTLVVAQGSQAEGWGREVAEILGQGLLFLEIQAPSNAVDVSIIVGHDIPSGEG